MTINQLTMVNTIIVMSIIIMTSQQADAAIYKCEKQGGVEFSQFPCAEDATLITVEEQNPSVPSAVVTHGKVNDKSVDSYIRIKQIEAQIQEHQNKVDGYREQMDNEIASLKNQSDAQVNNLTGSRKDSAIAAQMVSVSERYSALIEHEQSDIDRLTHEKLALQSNDTQLNTQTSEQSQAIDDYIQAQQIVRKIQQHQTTIDTYQSQMNRQVSVLQKQADKQPSYLTDTAFVDSISRKIAVVTSKYNTLIATEQRQIERLKKMQPDTD